MSARTPVVHTLKTVDPWFDLVAGGRKTFEIRKDDRGYGVGDILDLRSYDAAADTFTGFAVRVRVTGILRGPGFGIEAGYVVMSIERDGAMSCGLDHTSAATAEEVPGTEVRVAAEWAHGIAEMDGFWIVTPGQEHAEAVQACLASAAEGADPETRPSEDVAPVLREPRAVLDHLMSLLTEHEAYDVASVIECAFGGGENPAFPPGWDGSPIDQEQAAAALVKILRPWVAEHVGLPEYVVLAGQSQTIRGGS